ncbi:MAG: hypothetical protein US25_C0030G0002 [Candidatus Moranbacteria bacterium GW2011_GWE1_36_7]|nr:MAG: hypothetical protein US16_C0039G0002 [Candidatus Moranbacteria bacterium GW2011_GWE2_36_40]KKQ14080.1 MAG: hypothetical protein US25_C0030G0002 [Candidatus Moranbacteria bacterium GW2011_GWE1_36_7]
MCSTSRTSNLSPTSISIQISFYSTLNFIIKTRPTAKRFEFILRIIQWCSALFAYINSIFFIINIFPNKRSLCAFINNDFFSSGVSLFNFILLKIIINIPHSFIRFIKDAYFKQIKNGDLNSHFIIQCAVRLQRASTLLKQI